jgi:chromosomal replication initiator protein
VRRAILAKRARIDEVEVSNDVLNEIAARVDSSIRALEGALIRVVAYASLKGEEPTPELVRHVLRRLGDGGPPDACGLSEIVDAAAQEFGVEPASLRARNRSRDVVKARHVAMYLARQLTDLPQGAIARQIGAQDHTSVVHAEKKIGAAMLAEPAVRNSVDNVLRRLGRRL